MNTELSTRESFFTKDTLFYKTLFGLILTITLQNLIAYSVNMLDNIMLGSYSQNALSGAALLHGTADCPSHWKCTGSSCFSVLGPEADTANPGADWNCSEVLSAGLCVGYGGVHCLSCAAIENFYHFR